MGRFHQPDKYASTTAAVNPALSPAPAVEAPALTPAARSAAFRNVRVEVEGTNPLAKLGFIATIFYIFGVFSLSEELSISFFGVKPYLTTITGIVAFLAACFSGGLGNIMRFSPARLLLGFCLWMMIAIPFSTWRGGSMDTVSGYVTKSLVMMLFLLMMVTTWRQIRLVLYTMTASALILALAVRSSAVDLSATDPRMSFSGGRLANPNDLATHILVLVPFAVGLFFLSSRFSLLKPISAAVALLSLYTVLHTGSRGAMVSICIMGVLLVWMLPNAVHKLALVVSVLIMGALMLPLLPQSVLQRYKLLLADDATVPSNMMESQALESSEHRRLVLIRSIEVSFKNPLFGIGPGNFATAEAELAKQAGERGSWLQTHNGYTQVSSECGLPALILFAGAIFSCLRIAARYFKRFIAIPEFRGEAIMCLVVFMSLASFAINIFFASLAYTFYVPALAGILGALMIVMDRELVLYEIQKKERDAQPVAAVSPFGPMFNPRRFSAN